MSEKEPKFYACGKCGVVIEEIHGGKTSYSCDGIELTELSANTSEGAHEKHLPVVERSGNKVTVKVGSVFHPMSEEHSIEWIYLKTKKGCQRINLKSSDEPAAEFILTDGDEPEAAYAYCNLHGFWKTEI
ncbi:desulfoferrodoxin family protein [Murimonas intestini]|uniref:Superoxide reductase n=1 Tax=Murimonas intestini TaxID=1337051 RepID=A0AB73T9W0_9FIRM|nr:desulfoferrodoxin family protein [Murimonas intestini]MCR1839093.1 desulfoferrodoxin family protein [Murimonas intestini]MCR1864389.1 desulfoferrodoxin family protein [Murimonas intestini]MCR1881999.1 desulfoferrodoxin family protein [Murimonas intestini]